MHKRKIKYLGYDLPYMPFKPGFWDYVFAVKTWLFHHYWEDENYGSTIDHYRYLTFFGFSFEIHTRKYFL